MQNKKSLVFKFLVSTIVVAVPVIHFLSVQAQACAVMLNEPALPKAFKE